MLGVRHVLAAALCAVAVSAGVAHAQKVVRIGAPFELSGKFVAYGAQSRRGLEMAVEAFGGTVAGYKIEVLLRDNQSTNQGTVSTMTELLEKEKVEFIVGPVTSDLVSAAVPAWRQKKALWMVPGSSGTNFEKAIVGEPLVFHTYPFAYHYYDNTAKAMANAIGKGKKVAFVYTDGSYGRSHIQWAKSYYTEAGFEIVASELVRENAADMGPILQKIRLTKPDVLVGIVQTSDAIVLTKQIHVGKLGIPYLVGTGFPQLKTWSEAVGEAGNGWVGVTPYLPGMGTPADPKFPKIFSAMKDWEAAFRKKHNLEPEFMDVTVYTSSAMLLLAIERAGGPDKDKVAKELKNLGVATMLGESKFTPTKGGALNQAFNQMIVFQRQGDKSITIWPTVFANGKLKPNQ